MYVLIAGNPSKRSIYTNSLINRTLLRIAVAKFILTQFTLTQMLQGIKHVIGCGLINSRVVCGITVKIEDN